MNITTKRRPNGHHSILLDGMIIGEAWAWPRQPGYGVQLNGVYWRGAGLTEPSTKSGCTTTTVQKLKDIPAFATRTLAGLSVACKDPEASSSRPWRAIHKGTVLPYAFRNFEEARDWMERAVATGDARALLEEVRALREALEAILLGTRMEDGRNRHDGLQDISLHDLVTTEDLRRWAGIATRALAQPRE